MRLAPVMNIDHFMYAGPDLDRLCAGLQALTGIEPLPGGQHPQLGTHNRLAGSDTRLYLELIGPDPSTSQGSPMRASIEALPRPRLHRFIMDATGHDLGAVQAAYARAGIGCQVDDMHRLTPAGTTLRWRLLVPEANRYGLSAPFFIDWLDTPHPSTRLRADFAMTDCEAGHPDRAELAALWHELGVGITLHASDAPYLRVLLTTPRGPVAMASI